MEHFNSKCSDENTAEFCRLFAKGLTIAQAARGIGTTRQTVASWVNKRPEFAARFKEASAIRELLQ